MLCQVFRFIISLNQVAYVVSERVSKALIDGSSKAIPTIEDTLWNPGIFGQHALHRGGT